LLAEILPTCAIISPVTGFENLSSSPFLRSPVVGSTLPQIASTAFSILASSPWDSRRLRRSGRLHGRSPEPEQSQLSYHHRQRRTFCWPLRGPSERLCSQGCPEVRSLSQP